MDTGHQALVLFYAFFWAAALNVTGRFQPFDTPSIIWTLDKICKERGTVSN